MSRAIPLLTLWVFVVCSRVNCTFTLAKEIILDVLYQDVEGTPFCNRVYKARHFVTEYSRYAIL